MTGSLPFAILVILLMHVQTTYSASIARVKKGNFNMNNEDFKNMMSNIFCGGNFMGLVPDPKNCKVNSVNVSSSSTYQVNGGPVLNGNPFQGFPFQGSPFQGFPFQGNSDSSQVNSHSIQVNGDTSVLDEIPFLSNFLGNIHSSNINSGSSHVNSGSSNVNSGFSHVNSGSFNVNGGSSHVNSDSSNVNSESVHVDSESVLG